MTERHHRKLNLQLYHYKFTISHSLASIVRNNAMGIWSKLSKWQPNSKQVSKSDMFKKHDVLKTRILFSLNLVFK